MFIKWYGQTCFRISSQKNKNGIIDMLVDPFGKESGGLHPPKIKSDILLLNGASGDKKKRITIPVENNFLVTGAGEYDIKGINIQGISSKTKVQGETNIIYIIQSEGIKICHLGEIGEELSSEQIETIGDIDILMIPIGGGNAYNAKEAMRAMSQIEPRITIPMYYRIQGLTMKLDSLSEFLKSLGIESLQPIAKLSVKEKDINKDEAKIITLEP